MADSVDIKPADIISELGAENREGVSATDSTGDWYQVLKRESKKAETMEERENQGILERRERWSNWILIFIGIIVIFDIILVTFYGLGIWSFADPKVVIAVITDNFLKIVGLGFLITRESFKKIYH